MGPMHLIPSLAAFAAVGCAPEDRYQRTLDRVDSAGAQLAVIEPAGATWAGEAGEGRPDSLTEPGTAFLIGSNTKALTASVVLQLVDEGAVALADAASTWVPSLRPDITIQDLLQHTSGLGEYLEHEELLADAAMAQAWEPEALLALGQELGDAGPQATSVYANTNYIALGLLVEAVEGQDYRTSLTGRIFEPLGMSGSGFLEHGDATPAHLAWGDGGLYGDVTWVDASTGWAAGSAYATAQELARFYEAMLGGELFDQALADAQRAAVPADFGFEEEGVETLYGLGLMVVRFDGVEVVGHLGMVEGFTGLALHDPDSGAFSVLLTNASEVDFLTPSLKVLDLAGRQ